MSHAIIQIICAGFGTLGFSLFFRVRPAHLLFATLGGILSWTVYLICYHWLDVFFSSLIAAFVVCLWAELMARARKAPATIFLIPGIIPLLPGGALYYAMSGIINTERVLFVGKGMETIYIAVGIVGGILFASEIVRVIMRDFGKSKKNESASVDGRK